jgi:cobalt-zinc-cadmium efflux system outer membrane protein
VNAAQLEDFFRNLRAAATNAYVDGLSGQLSLERKKRSLETLERLVASNQERLRAGDIGEVDLLQSRVAALQTRSDFLAAESIFEQSLIGLTDLLGNRDQRVLFNPRGTLQVPPLIEFRIIYLQGKEVGLLPEGHHQSGSAAHPLERATRLDA